MISLEVQGMIRYMANSGIPFKVTDINTPGVHVAGSYHYRQGTGGNGLAVDFAGPEPSVAAPALRRIVDRFMPVSSRLAEFLHPWNRADHQDHVHIAVPLGTILAPGEPMPTPTEPLLTAFPFGGGYVIVTVGGAVYCFNCDYHGGLQWNGTNWELRH